MGVVVDDDGNEDTGDGETSASEALTLETALGEATVVSAVFDSVFEQPLRTNARPTVAIKACEVRFRCLRRARADRQPDTNSTLFTKTVVLKWACRRCDCGGVRQHRHDDAPYDHDCRNRAERGKIHTWQHWIRFGDLQNPQWHDAPTGAEVRARVSDRRRNRLRRIRHALSLPSRSNVRFRVPRLAVPVDPQ